MNVSEVFRLGASCPPGAREGRLRAQAQPRAPRLPLHREHVGHTPHRPLVTPGRSALMMLDLPPLPSSCVWGRVRLLKILIFAFEIG